jgi:hypothetical protein
MKMTNDARIITTCKGICIRHKASGPPIDNRYSTGQKRCQICEIFIKWDGLWCPCCGYRLRKNPRNLKSESKLRARKKTAEYQLIPQQLKREICRDIYEIMQEPMKLDIKV